MAQWFRVPPGPPEDLVCFTLFISPEGSKSSIIPTPGTQHPLLAHTGTQTYVTYIYTHTHTQTTTEFN